MDDCEISVKVPCEHEKLEREEPFYAGVTAKVNSLGKELPEYIAYSPYRCKQCGKRYLVLQAVVG